MHRIQYSNLNLNILSKNNFLLIKSVSLNYTPKDQICPLPSLYFGTQPTSPYIFYHFCPSCCTSSYVYLFVYLFIYCSFYLSIFIHFSPSLSPLSISLSIHFSFCLFFFLCSLLSYLLSTSFFVCI